MEMAAHIVLNEGSNVPFKPVGPDGFHAYAKPWVLAHQSHSVFPHQDSEMRTDVVAVHPLHAARALKPQGCCRQYAEECDDGKPAAPPPLKKVQGEEGGDDEPADGSASLGHKQGCSDAEENDAENELP